jgi:hypothetical protein
LDDRYAHIANVRRADLTVANAVGPIIRVCTVDRYVGGRMVSDGGASWEAPARRIADVGLGGSESFCLAFGLLIDHDSSGFTNTEPVTQNGEEQSAQ